jgi:short-subunit dehydrogenase
MHLKPLSEQTVVLTGATSGIGLVTARQAAERGANVVLVSRNEDALAKLVDELRKKNGTKAIYVVGDVSKEDDLLTVAASTIHEFGNFDTWINNAGVSIYGKLEDVKLEDSKRLFETNFWGVVIGSTIAARHLRLFGGAIINVGSTLSDRAIPVQGMYCASKHAVKGFTDALRMELEADGAPISVTLIKPSAIDTPYKEHAKNYLDQLPENPPPVYAPELVAETILFCAENPVRDCFVGAGGKAIAMFGNLAPRATDVLMENTMIDMQKSGKTKNGKDRVGLFESNDSRLKERGDYEGHVIEHNVYTKASLHPIATRAAVAAGVGAAVLLARGMFRSESNTH